jgi:hypothetical protein
VIALREHSSATARLARSIGLRLAWRGPDTGNPDPDAVRLVLADRHPDDALGAALATHGMA